MSTKKSIHVVYGKRKYHNIATANPSLDGKLFFIDPWQALMVNSGMYPKIQFKEPQFDTLYTAPETLGERKVSILEAAHEILAKEGYQGFTMRRVAHQAQMHLKTLQHYFSTKKDLLIGVLRYSVLKKYKEFWETLVRKQSENPRDIFQLAIDYLINDAKDPLTSRFFPELWALSTRDPDAADAMEELYALYRSIMDKLIRVLNPTLPEQSVARRAVAIIAMIEGMTLFIGPHNMSRPVEMQNIEEEVVSAALQIVFMP